MFGSMAQFTEPRMRSTFKLPSSIKLDFAPAPGSGRRSSFLPADFADEGELGRSQYKFISGSKEVKVSQRPSGLLDQGVEMRSFLTGSRYIGQVNQLGMAGKGIYKFPHGTIYDGHFNKQGEFHGTGSLIYPAGQRVEGIWKKGKLVSGGANFVGSDNAKYDSNYCEIPDRRFQIELDYDVQPAGQEFLTNAEVPRTIPDGMYDTGYGFYDPQRKVVIDYQDPERYKNLYEMMDEERRILYQTLEMDIEDAPSSEDIARQSKTKKPDNIIWNIIAVPAEEKEKWVKNNCRKPWDENVGYRPDLYEVWNAGYGRENYKVSRELSKLSHSKANALIKKFSRPKPKTSNLYSFTTAKIKSQVTTLEDHIEYQMTMKKRQNQPDFW